jgi:Flp pilus assembly protein TadG
VKTLVQRLRDDDSGVVTVLAALCMVVLMGFVALAVDSGSLYVQRTQMQKAVDGAALAGAYDIGINTQNAADATTYARKNGVTSGELTVNRYATTFAASDSWTVTASRQVSLAFAPFLGINTGTITVSATAINSPINGVPGSNLMPYAIWGGNSPMNLGAGATVDYRDNSWADDNVTPDPDDCGGRNQPACNPNWTTNSNDFKGFLRIVSGTIYQNGSVVTDGGNSTGQEPIDDDGGTTTICDHVRLGTPGIFPVIGSGSGNGHVDLTIIGFVFIQMNPVRGCGGAQGMNVPFTGTVVNATTWNGNPGGSANSGFPVARVLKLWQ